jgi:hypothetical protein
MQVRRFLFVVLPQKLLRICRLPIGYRALPLP